MRSYISCPARVPIPATIPRAAAAARSRMIGPCATSSVGCNTKIQQGKIWRSEHASKRLLPPCGRHAHILFRWREIIRIVCADRGVEARFTRQPKEEIAEVLQRGGDGRALRGVAPPGSSMSCARKARACSIWNLRKGFRLVDVSKRSMAFRAARQDGNRQAPNP